MPSDATIGGMARSLLNARATCPHCKQSAELEVIKDDTIMACHVYSDRYVSRIMEYGKELDQGGFKEFVQSATVGLGQVVEDADIRIASRYAWDLGLDRADDDLVLREACRTQNHRRTKRDEPNRPALFFCANCRR